MLYGLVGGLFGLISEPVKCVKRRGIKGVPAGLGKGVLGLFCKPVAGTIDFVTCTIRGVNNMPRSLYRGIKKIKVRKEARKEDMEPRKTLEPLQKTEEVKQTVLEEEIKEEKDLCSVLQTLTTRKQELLQELILLKTHNPSPFHTEEDDSGDCSFRTAHNEDEALTESQYYGKFHAALEIAATKEEIRRISENIGRLSEAGGSPGLEKEEANIDLEAAIYIQSSLQWRPIDDDSDYRPNTADSKGGLKLSTSPVSLPWVKSFIHQSPIETKAPSTTLHRLLDHALCSPLLVTRAALVGNYRERMKLVVVEVVASLGLQALDRTAMEGEPGETLCGEMEYGVQLYAEKTGKDCIHMDIEGPEGLYRLFGYTKPHVKHHINSITVNIIQLEDAGKRSFRFLDGHVISHTLPSYLYSGTLLGQTRCQATGSLFFEDRENGITCEVHFASDSEKPGDYLEGALMIAGEVRASLKGTYLGWLEWDDVRYWDARYSTPSLTVSPNISPSIHFISLPTLRPDPTFSVSAKYTQPPFPIALILRISQTIRIGLYSKNPPST
jgi:hypothetical protein